jgi:hypothetical protein
MSPDLTGPIESRVLALERMLSSDAAALQRLQARATAAGQAIWGYDEPLQGSLPAVTYCTVTFTGQTVNSSNVSISGITVELQDADNLVSLATTTTNASPTNPNWSIPISLPVGVPTCNFNIICSGVGWMTFTQYVASFTPAHSGTFAFGPFTLVP